MSDQNTASISNNLTHLADYIDHRAVTQLDRGIAITLRRMGEDHDVRPGSINCQRCGMGDVEWPCYEYLDGIALGVDWLVTKIEQLEQQTVKSMPLVDRKHASGPAPKRVGD